MMPEVFAMLAQPDTHRREEAANEGEKKACPSLCLCLQFEHRMCVTLPFDSGEVETQKFASLCTRKIYSLLYTCNHALNKKRGKTKELRQSSSPLLHCFIFIRGIFVQRLNGGTRRKRDAPVVQFSEMSGIGVTMRLKNSEEKGQAT